MKKYKLYFQIGIAVGLTIISVLFFVITIYYLYKKDLGNAGIFATLISIPLAFVPTIWTYIIKKNKRNTFIEQYLNDEHFVDREIEYTKLFDLINDHAGIIYIKGKIGMGKTVFMKMACDRINFIHKKKWKSYTAFYFNNSHTKITKQGIANKYCGNPNATIEVISKLLNSVTLKKNIVLFIDDIYENDLLECIEFAKAFIKCNDNNQVVIAVDSNDGDSHICPGEFGENEIELLANSYNINLENNKRHEIFELSNGYPVYARYSVEAYSKNVNILEYGSLESYLEELICSLNNLEKAFLSLIICLGHLLRDGIEVKVICGIDNRITKPVIKRLTTSSLITLYNNKIYIDKLISLKCMDFLSEYKNESYNQIYTYYKNLPDVSYIALLAALKSNFKYDKDLIKELLDKQYINNNFYILIDIGELEFNRQINPHLREDKECWIYVRYYYLKSLLELGLYDKAREVVDKSDNQFNLLNMNKDIDFEYQYLLADLDHLTNYLKDAVTFSKILVEKALTVEQRVRCQYLYAHCLRHIGEDLNQAFSVFSDLANSEYYKDDKIRIRSIYSAASIKMFQGDINYNYERAFEEIEEIICCDPKNDIWKPYVTRHKAIYEYKMCNNFYNAERLLKQAIKCLEVTPLRIKYDIYFELGEIYRMYDRNTANYDRSLDFYLEAAQFATRVHDYNLQSSSQLGMMLLNIKYGQDIDADLLRTIITNTHKIDLIINYNYSLYVKYIVANEPIPKELLTYWEQMQYSDLLLFSSKIKSEKCDIKLTVM